MRNKTMPRATRKLIRLTMICMLLIGISGLLPAGRVSAAGSVIYVKQSAGGGNNGSSWADAYINLQSALLAAGAGDQVWVAAGTYHPTEGTDSNATFRLETGVAIYGGFAGTETELEQRNPKTNVTILSGEIGAQGSLLDNSYHVVTGSNTDDTAVLDGFTITGGYALPAFPNYYGAGIYILNGNPTLSNLIISQNKANSGGGMFNNTASPKLTNVTLINNSAQVAGGGIYNNLKSNPELNNVTFVNNTAIVQGGGMSVSDGSPKLTNVTFTGNTAINGGGLQNSFAGNPVLVNVTFSGNSATNGGAIYNLASNPAITNSILYNDTGGEIYNDTSTPLLTYSIVQGGYVGLGNLNVDPQLGLLQDNGGYTKTMAIGRNSPVKDAGDESVCPETDQRGFSRPRNVPCDLGAYEVDDVPPDTAINSQPSDPDIDQTPTFTFSGDDHGGSGIASFMCKMDSDGYSPCTSPFTPSTLTFDTHTFHVYAVDADANVDPSPASYTWTLNSISTEVVSILPANTSPNSSTYVDFTVTFSADVTDVDRDDFLLITTGVKGASITNVSGSASSYTVTVNTGRKKGTIGLQIPSEATIEDSYGRPLANLPFTGGEEYEIDKGANTVGVFRPTNGVIFLKNSNATGYADVSLNYGVGGDYPIAGDWDGDGIDSIGVYRKGWFYLRNSNSAGYANLAFPFGTPGDQPIAGDWDGDGIDTIGVYNSKTITFSLRNSNTAGAADYVFRLGIPSDVGIAGDWTGKGFDTVGVFRPSNGVIFLKNTNATGYADISINYGIGGDKPVTGDWDNNGTDTIGVLRGNMFYLRNSNTVGYADTKFALGNPGDMPIAGNWDGKP